MVRRTMCASRCSRASSECCSCYPAGLGRYGPCELNCCSYASAHLRGVGRGMGAWRVTRGLKQANRSGYYCTKKVVRISHVSCF